MPQNTRNHSSQKAIWDKIQYVGSVILALGAIAAVVTGAANWFRQGATEPPIATPTVNIDNSNQADISNEGAEAKAENGPINIGVQPSSQAPQSTAPASATRSITPSTKPTPAVAPASVPDPQKQVTPNQTQPQSDSSDPNTGTSNQIMTNSPGGAQVQDSPGATVTTGDSSVTEATTINNNAPTCVGGIGNACAPDTIINNDLNGATIDNRATTP